VVVLGPGRPCLACWRHLDGYALRIEALTVDQRESDGNVRFQGASSE
jgi:hypothetical protein